MDHVLQKLIRLLSVLKVIGLIHIIAIFSVFFVNEHFVLNLSSCQRFLEVCLLSNTDISPGLGYEGTVKDLTLFLQVVFIHVQEHFILFTYLFHSSSIIIHVNVVCFLSWKLISCKHLLLPLSIMV